MNKKRIYLLIAFLALVIIIFFVTINLSLYRISSRLNSYWIQESEYQQNGSSNDLYIYYSDSISSASILVSTLENDLPVKIDGCEKIRVKLEENIKIGLSRFIPVFKITKFDSDFDVVWSGKIKNRGDIIDITKKGSFIINGKIKTFGFCSAKKTKQIIQDKIIEQARKMITEDVQNEIEKI